MKTISGKRLLTIIVLFQALLLALGAGLFLAKVKKPAARAVASTQETEIFNGDAPKELADLQSAEEEQLAYWADTLPKFDGREFGYITPARSQGTRNTCWAYAAVGAAEVSILREGINKKATKDNLDFDETIAAYNRHTRDGDQDPLLLTTNDTYDFGRWNQGDAAVNALAIMTQGYTLLRENSFHPSVEISKIKSCLQQSEYYVQSYQSISNDKNAIKRAILQYGAVIFNYSAPSHKKYYDPTAWANHTSIIVGWDDSVKSSEFSPRQPQGDGAWIIKNSWGNDEFNGGYNKINGTWCYYISYELPIGSLYSVDLEMREDYQNIYYYDGNITGSMIKVPAEAQAAIYEAKLSSPAKQEQLKAVMISVPEEDLDVNIKIYKNLKANPGNVNDNINQPDQGVPVEEADTHLERSGMHTIDLKTPVGLNQGEYFSIVVSCKRQNGSSVPVNCAVENRDSVNDMTYYFYDGKWNSYKRSDNYADTSSVNQSARIRAITNTVDRESNLGNDLKYARVEIANRLVYYGKGKQLIPEIQVYLEGKLLENGRDYSIKAQEIASPGMTAVNICGSGSYKGVRTTYFEVAKPVNPPDAMSGTVLAYNDAIYLHDIPIPDGWAWGSENRKLEYGTGGDAATLVYVGEDKAFYQNTTCTFYVNKIDQDPPAEIDIATAETEISGEYVYTGAEIIPSVKVTCNGKELRAGIDYLLTFQNNIYAGTATAIIDGNMRYFGQMRLDFEIRKADFPAQAPPSSMTVPRKAKTLQAIALSEGWQWEAPNTEIDRESMQAWAVFSDTANYENYRMQITLTKEPPKDISALDVELETLSFVYNGTEQTPNVIAKDGEAALVAGVDFDIRYQNNKNAGQGNATVTFKNDYTGSETFTFTIERAERQDFQVVFAGWTYGDTPPSPRTEGEMETSAVTYTYSDAENGVYTEKRPINAGVYWVKAEIEPSQNYRAAAAKTEFTVSKALSPAQAPPSSMTVPRKTTTLQAIALSEGWQWETPDTEIDRESMQAWAVFSDTANYENYRLQITLTKEPPKDISALDVKLETLSFVYNGTEQTPNIIAKDGEAALVAGVDFDIRYRNNKNAGQASVIVNGKYDYSGIKELPFTIMQAEKPAADTTIRYSGKATVLSDIPLPDGFVWADGNAAISENRMTATAVYQGDDASNYKTTELSFEIIIEEQEEQAQRGSPVWLAAVIPVSVLTLAGLGFAIAKRRHDHFLK